MRKDYDVLRLDVAMDDTRGVRVRESRNVRAKGAN